MVPGLPALRAGGLALLFILLAPRSPARADTVPAASRPMMWRLYEEAQREEARRSAETEQGRRRRAEESDRCVYPIDDRICGENPSRCPCLGTGRCGKSSCRPAPTPRALAETAPRPVSISPCGPLHACLAFRHDCACSHARACPYAQCTRLSGDLFGETLPMSLPPSDTRSMEALIRDFEDTRIIRLMYRPLDRRDFSGDTCATPGHRSACRMGISCPCVFDGLCGEPTCGKTPEY